jgi:hypothetical protein
MVRPFSGGAVHVQNFHRVLARPDDYWQQARRSAVTFS